MPEVDHQAQAEQLRRRIGHVGVWAGSIGSLPAAEERAARIVDAIVAWGDQETIAGRVREHLQAGADHVAVQVCAEGATLGAVEQLERLAPALMSLAAG